MKIIAIDCFPVALPYDSGAPPLPLGGRARTRMESLLVRVRTDAGIDGWGDAFGVRVWPVTRAMLDGIVAPLCLGHDALDREGLMRRLSETLYHFGDAGPLMYAMSGVEIALWDIAGKARGVPVHALLGGARRTEVDVYASLLPYRDPALVGRFAGQAVDEGYRYVKLHERDVPSVARARAAIGDAGLMIDVNCAFDVDGAARFAEEIAGEAPMWLEEPVFPPGDEAAIAALASRCEVPLALGENVGSPVALARIARALPIAFIQPSVIKAGGIQALLATAAAIDGTPVRMMPHSAYFGPGLLATLHVLAAQAESPIIERFYCRLPVEPCGALTEVREGRMAVPQRPGLGFEPTEAFLETYAA